MGMAQLIIATALGFIVAQSGLSFAEFKARWLDSATTRASREVVIMEAPPP